MDLALRGEEARDVAERLIKVYFKTQDYPYTRHHIESFDQFLSQDLPAIIGSANPITLLEKQIGDTTQYTYKADIYVGGFKGDQIYIGTPTVSLKDSQEVRLLFPNEARLRNLTYAAVVQADIVVRITYTVPDPERAGAYKKQEVILDPIADPGAYGYLARFPLFRMPIMLHSRYCTLHGKPQVFLKEAGECQYDQGGYFVVNGSEKVLITHQQQAFNTLYINKQDDPYDPKVAVYASVSCLNPTTRELRRVAFGLLRRENVLQVSIPFVRKPVPLFVLFRALGITSDQEILRTIFPDPDAAETKLLEPLLHESILEAYPFYDTYSAVQYIKVLTKGFSEAHVLHILNTQLFVHVANRPKARAAYLAECVRRILRVSVGIDPKTDRDDTRNQRCLTSGVLIRQLFQDLYVKWKKAVTVTLSSEFKYHESNYEGRNYQNLFIQGTLNEMFKAGQLTEGLMRAFRGKWSSGSGAGVGEEKSGVIQALSRLSFLDFMSHCRRVVLDFDTGMKLASPRRLHTSQYGYFCTNETPNGASIGVTKNLSVLAAISTATDPNPFIDWLFTRGGVYTCEQMTPGMIAGAVPVSVNNGIIGYSFRPLALRDALRVLKWTGCLPATTGIGFSPRDRRVFIYMDEGRPVRPLIHLGPRGEIPVEALRRAKSWRDLIMGVLPISQRRTIYQTGFIDPLESEAAPTLEDYVEKLAASAGVIEYMDPYEMNEAYIANFPEHIQSETSHLEIHPSTIVGLLTSMIPYANHNQSPRNQLSCSQSKQGISMFSTAFPNRYDNQVHVMCYAQAPLSRTIYYDYLADGQIGYGTNLILAMGSFTGYNQDDGILMNADSVERGMFRSTCFRSYEAYEEDDPLTMSKTRIGNPAKIPGWTSLKPGVDYSQLDDRGLVRVGALVDENSVLVGRYLQLPSGELRDNSVTAQVWTRGRVEKVSATVSPAGMVMVKVRVVQERIPELGDKFSNRHGQKGTIGMLLRGYDMPRTRAGIPVDMMMNPHAIPSRMTMAQLLEMILGRAVTELGAVGNATMFMNEGNPGEQIGAVLRDYLGMEPMGEELLYDGMSGQFIPSQVFLGNSYTMRLKHMPEDKWNARGEGRREQRTHQPTAGRGAQGGLRVGEMERDAYIAHGISGFIRESFMKRADGYSTVVCNGCGTIPIYNESERFYLCPACDGPVRFSGDSAGTLEILPPNKRSVVSFSRIEIPYSVKLLDQEMNAYMNMGMRFLTDKDLKTFRKPGLRDITEEQTQQLLAAALPERQLPELGAPEYIPPAEEEKEVRPEDLAALGALPPSQEEVAEAPAAPEATAAAALSLAPPAPLPQVANNGLPTVVLAPPQPAAPAAAAAPPQDDLEEADIDAMPVGPPAPPLQQGGGVNVQTATQPVLVVPVNVGTAPPSAEMYSTGIPGAPTTIAVDTSASAMQRTGLPPLQGAPLTHRGGSRSSSRGSSRSGGGGPPAATARVTVNKMGGGSSTPDVASNVRVTVTKTG